MSAPSYSLVVVTWRSAGELGTLIDSLEDQLADLPELVVVDNASGDGVESVARSWRGRTRFVALEENLGYGAAANVGVGVATGEAVVLLNPDTKLVDRGLPRLARAALERRALVGPRMLDEDGSIQPSASGPPVGIWPWIGALVPAALAPPPIRARTEPWRLQEPAQVAWLTGACVAAPRDVLVDLGPFDPSIHLYSEDLDLGIRAARRGIASHFLPDVCRVVHFGDRSSAQRFADRGLAVAAQNRRAVLRRAYGARRELAAWWALRANLRLRIAIKRVLGRPADRDSRVLAATRAAAELTPLPDRPLPDRPLPDRPQPG